MKIQLLLLLVLGIQAFGQGSFQYVSNRDGGVLFSYPTDIDLNEDGNEDLSLGFATIASPGSGNAVTYLDGNLLGGLRVLTDSHEFEAAFVPNGGSRIDNTISVRLDHDSPPLGQGPYNWFGDTHYKTVALGAVWYL